MLTASAVSRVRAACIAALVLLVFGTASAYAQTTVTAAWDRNTDSYTAGYRVYYGTSSGSYQWNLDAGNQISAPITLTPGSLYYVSVRAYNAQSELGPPSNEATIDLRLPAPTAQITATLGANNVATVNWSSANAATATINGSAVALSGSMTVAVTAQTTFTLVARAADGRTATASATVTPAAAPAPTAQITATLGANNVATVNWSSANAATATINGQAVGLSGSTTVAVTAQTTFTLIARAADGRTATASATVTPAAAPAPTAQITATLGANNVATVTWTTSNATTATINGQAVGLAGSATVAVTAQTTFTLIARAADGRTATASATVTPAAAPAPTAQITATLGTDGVATVTWATTNATSASINGQAVGLTGTTTVAVSSQTTFTITARAADGRTATASATVTPQAPTAAITAALQDAESAAGGDVRNAVVSWQSANASTVTINDVAVAPSGTSTVTITETTTFTIRAVNAAGQVATASATVTVPAATAPGVPRSMSSSVSGSRVRLSWLAPNSGGAPTHYLVSVGDRAGWSNVLSGYNVGNVLTVSGDLPRGTYYARVRAANGAGTSLNSNEAKFTIGRRLRSPTGVRVTWSGTTARIDWVAPAADTTDDVPTSYVLDAGTAPGLSNVASIDVGNTTSFQTDVPSGNYYVRVRALNPLGESDPSEEIEVRAPGTPQAPSSLISVASSGPVDLRWSASAGGYAALGYVIEAGSAPGLADLATLNVGNVTQFTTVAPPGTYYVRVRAINDRGVSLPSNEVVVRR